MRYKNHPEISIDPKICHGKPVISGTRIMVRQLLAALASSQTVEEIIKDYPNITKEQISAALSFASDLVDFEEIDLEAA